MLADVWYPAGTLLSVHTKAGSASNAAHHGDCWRLQEPRHGFLEASECVVVRQELSASSLSVV